MFSWVCVVVATCQPVVVNSSVSVEEAVEASEVKPSISDTAVRTKNSTKPLDAQLRQLGLRLKSKYLSAGGIRRAAIAGSQDYKNLQALSAELADFDLSQLETANQKKAFWINVYNALAIQGLVFRGQTTTASVLDIPEFFARTAYRVGGLDWSLDQIEHGILRANSKPPFTLLRTLYKDQRLWALSKDEVDPRVHFALNCGSKSCPPIAFFSADKLDEQLDLAVTGFLQSETRVENEIVFTSKMLDWYGNDFQPSLREFLLKYTDGDVKEALANPDVEIRFSPYNWAVD